MSGHPARRDAAGTRGEPSQAWGLAGAVALSLAVVWARLLALWITGAIRTEPFFGSAAWNIAIALPVAAHLTRRGVARHARVRRLTALVTTEPLVGWHRRIRRLDLLAGWATPVRAVEDRVRSLTGEIVEAYPRLGEVEREQVRLLWRTYGHFGDCASLAPRPGSVADGDVRRELLLHSIRDQLPDARDAAVALGHLRAEALAGGVDFSALAREVAELSDDTRRTGMFGSTREVLRRNA